MELTTDDILQSVQCVVTQGEKGSNDNMDNDAMDNDGAVVAPKVCDESLSPTDVLDYLKKCIYRKMWHSNQSSTYECGRSGIVRTAECVLHPSENNHGLLQLNVRCLMIMSAFL